MRVPQKRETSILELCKQATGVSGKAYCRKRQAYEGKPSLEELERQIAKRLNA